MSEQLTLSAEARERAGKGASRELRRQGLCGALGFMKTKDMAAASRAAFDDLGATVDPAATPYMLDSITDALREEMALHQPRGVPNEPSVAAPAPAPAAATAAAPAAAAPGGAVIPIDRRGPAQAASAGAGA